MNRLLKHPATNAICLSIFSGFYATLFIVFSRVDTALSQMLYYRDPDGPASFMTRWSGFLASGNLSYLAYGFLGLTAVVIIMLIIRRRPYDEYQMTILRNCLAVALALTLVAIALFYWFIMINPFGIVEKFTLFVAINWATVLLADIVYILLCRR